MFNKIFFFFFLICFFSFTSYATLLTHDLEENAHNLFIQSLSNPDQRDLSKKAELALRNLIKRDPFDRSKHYEIRLLAVLALEIEQYQHARHKLMKSNHVAQQFSVLYQNKIKNSDNYHLLYEYHLYSGLIFVKYPSFNGTTKDGLRSLKQALKYAKKINISSEDKAFIYYHMASAYSSMKRVSKTKKYVKKCLANTTNDELINRVNLLLAK
eukprot:COSAG01_NODE_14_length_41020_cov_40.702133_9_plen_212_part_00